MLPRTLLLSLLLASSVAAQPASYPAALPPVPTRGPSPLLFLRFVGPTGMRVTFLPGSKAARSFEAPAPVGIRAGYVVRVQLDHFTADPNLVLHPSIEVRGSLWLGPKPHAADYPAPVVLTEADLERIKTGALVTKVIYLENPDTATPIPTKSDAPLEQDRPFGDDLLEAARQAGRPVAVVRFGDRQVPPEELARFAIPGVVLLPGQHFLAPASVPPCLPLADRIFLDPIAGPRPPEEECLSDGGDTSPRAVHDQQGRLLGVDPSDTVAEYTDAGGRRRIVCSNRVCVCVPRFAVLRSVTPFGQYDGALVVGDTRLVVAQEQVRRNMPSVQAGQVEHLKGVKGRERASAFVAQTNVGLAAHVQLLQAHQLDLGPVAALASQALVQLREQDKLRLLRQIDLARELSRLEGVKETDQVTRTSVVARVQNGTEVVSASMETRDFTVCCNEEPRVPEKPLVLYKCADRTAAKVGDVVTFTLRYSNHGGRPLTDVAVADSLTGRLEYIAGSAQSDRDAVLTMQENEAGSLLLRWEVTGKLLPGQVGTVRFQARVR